MKRRLVLLAAWLAATTASVLIASFAVGAVGKQVSQEPASVLVAARSPALPPATGATVAPTTAATLPPGTTTAVTARPGATAPSTSSTLRPSEPDPTLPSPPATSPPAGSASSSTTAPATTAAPAPAGGIKTLVGRGGSLAVEVRGGRLVFLGAVPSAGFSIADQDVSATEIRVEFESDDHETKIRAELNDGVFDGDVDEDPKD